MRIGKEASDAESFSLLSVGLSSLEGWEAAAAGWCSDDPSMGQGAVSLLAKHWRA